MTGEVFNVVMRSTLFFSIPLMIVALGGLFSEKSGVVNIALEGKMLMGAFAGVLFIGNAPEAIPSQLILVLGMLVAMVTGLVVSILHAYAAIHLKANQIISGIAINMFAAAFVVYAAMQINLTTQGLHSHNMRFNGTQFVIESVPGLSSIPIIGPMFFQNAYITTYIAFGILAVAAFVLYKTKFGLRLRACGEHPHAADSVGVSVVKIRYAGVLISGALAGIGGLVYIVPISNMFSGNVAGYGFLALAVLIFGGWHPGKILFAAFFFGLTQAISNSAGSIAFLAALNVPVQFYRMSPYVATLIVLAFTSKNTMAPKAIGQPYDKGGR